MMNRRSGSQKRIALFVLLIAICAITYGILQVSYAILFIIAIPGVFGYLFWYYTYLRRPADTKDILPIFLITVAAFEFHIIEEYKGGYSLAISRIFNFAWTDSAFFITNCVLTGALMLVCTGLYYKKEIAGFIAIMFIVTRFAEMALFIFPFIPPSLQPNNPDKISAIIGGTLITDMPNYYYPAKHVFYFPGMFTVILVIIPAIIALIKIYRSCMPEKSPTF